MKELDCSEISLSVPVKDSMSKELSARKPVPANYDTTKYKYSFNEVRAEIAKPFEEKLKRTKQLIKMFANVSNICLSCSFGKDSMAVLHLVLQENPKIPVNFNNTLCEFPETLTFKDQIVDSWDLNFAELKPAKGVNFFSINRRIVVEGLNRDDGRKHTDICCDNLKKKPFKLWRKNLGITKSFTGITASESRHRFTTACMKGTDYYTFRDGLYKIHPILYWSEKEVWNFTHDLNLPVNPAYEKYRLKRIGCMWCMSYKGWRKQIARLNNKMYCYILKNFCQDKQWRISDPSYYEPNNEVYA